MSKLPDISKDFSGWYNEIVYQAELADQSPVRGTIIIRPYGCALWEIIQAFLDKRIKETGHQNAIFPLFIPESFLKKEAKHVEGFAPELAVVTHAGGKELEEPLVVRPTSETIIHYMFAKWIKSWRDLPLKINQWANVVRWEMRARPFLRTTEFFWQEGHTAHATHDEALKEVLMMLNEYINLCENHLAIPVVTGLKSESEKFPGAEKTYTFEGLMPDGKALQMGTSHLLSQTFAHAFEMKFQDQEGNLNYPYLTSWAVTTRLIGALVMVHGDQKGLILPPKVAPIQVVIVPILKSAEENQKTIAVAKDIEKQLVSLGIRVFLDADETKTPGAKFYQWELKGVPLRMEIGPRDIANKQVVMVDRLGASKKTVAIDGITNTTQQLLEEFQQQLFERARNKRDSMWFKAQKLSEFGPKIDEQPGFYQTGWCGQHSCEELLKEYKATIRVLLESKEFKECFNCSNKSLRDVLIAKSY